MYGLVQYVVAPFAVKRFYEKRKFTDTGKSKLDDPFLQDSILLARLNADHVFAAETQGYRVEQYEAFPETRRKFTMSRVRRKRNQARFTVTVLHSNSALTPFCARPTTVTDAMEYMLDTRNIKFPDDEHFANRLHILAEDHESVRQCMTPIVRNQLTKSEAIALECLATSSGGSTLILKRPRDAFDVSDKLTEELESIVQIHQELEAQIVQSA